MGCCYGYTLGNFVVKSGPSGGTAACDLRRTSDQATKSTRITTSNGMPFVKFDKYKAFFQLEGKPYKDKTYKVVVKDVAIYEGVHMMDLDENSHAP